MSEMQAGLPVSSDNKQAMVDASVSRLISREAAEPDESDVLDDEPISVETKFLTPRSVARVIARVPEIAAVSWLPGELESRIAVFLRSQRWSPTRLFGMSRERGYAKPELGDGDVQPLIAAAYKVIDTIKREASKGEVFSAQVENTEHVPHGRLLMTLSVRAPYDTRPRTVVVDVLQLLGVS